ncbi:hypothetical protein ACFCXR_15605 [Streptomyces noursei]|uniref:hypothetical protein n=1 Tax=Streptomyces noursei TaxID=1971 RepID=UPI0035DBBB14
MEAPIPNSPHLPLNELLCQARDFTARMADIDRDAQTALDLARDRYGRTVHHQAESTARAHRNSAALNAYATHLAPHAEQLLQEAQQRLDEVPHPRYTDAWRALLASLAASHTEIVRVIDQPPAAGSPAEREQHSALWPHLAYWADNGSVASNLADQNHRPEPELTGEERDLWTEKAQAAQQRGELDLIESWFAADGRRITLAYLVEDDTTSTVIALAGDPDVAGWEVIGHYAHEYAAGQALPRPAPPGVFRPDGSRFNRPESAPEVPLQELVHEVHEAHGAADVSEALLTATRHGHDAGAMVRLQELVHAASQFSSALETAQGQHIAARLAVVGRQLEFLTSEVEQAAEDLEETLAVLPPHRIPAPLRVRPRPAVDTTPAPAPPRSATVPHRL